jgi:hypothetical protein
MDWNFTTLRGGGRDQVYESRSRYCLLYGFRPFRPNHSTGIHRRPAVMGPNSAEASNSICLYGRLTSTSALPQDALPLCCAVLALASGCAASASSPVTASIYNASKGATAATSNDLGSKTGQSCATSILGIIGSGDASVASAAKAGGITKISAVDSDNSGILGIYAKNCTVVSGE